MSNLESDLMKLAHPETKSLLQDMNTVLSNRNRGTQKNQHTNWRIYLKRHHREEYYRDDGTVFVRFLSNIGVRVGFWLRRKGFNLIYYDLLCNFKLKFRICSNFRKKRCPVRAVLKIFHSSLPEIQT